MYNVSAHTIGEAWLKTAALVLNNQFEVIQDDKGDIIELRSVLVQIKSPESKDSILEKYGNKDVMHFMQQNFRITETISNWGYSYAQRLYNYHGVNQIKRVAELLQSNQFSKSATISLLEINGDQNHKPCLVSIDFKVRNETLTLTCFFRSQDIGKKMYADALELLYIGNTIAQHIKINAVELIFFVCSAHIYRDDCETILKILTMELLSPATDLET